jgi:hypothetical protein
MPERQIFSMPMDARLPSPQIKMGSPKKENLEILIANARKFNGDLAKASKIEPAKLEAFLSHRGKLDFNETNRLVAVVVPGFWFDGDDFMPGTAPKQSSMTLMPPEPMKRRRGPQNV